MRRAMRAPPQAIVRGVVFAVVTCIIGVVFLSSRPVEGSDADLVTYRATLGQMAEGVDYYTAMERALVAIDSAPSQIRSIRLPTAFFVWRIGIYTRLGAFLTIVATGVIVAIAAGVPFGLATVFWLSIVAFPFRYEQWGSVELWILPLVTGAILAIRLQRWGTSCALAFSASCFRELCVPMLVGGAIAAHRARRPVWPWLLSLAAWAALFAWHAVVASAHLHPSGGERELLFTGGLASVLAMAGPYSYGVGLVVVVAALISARWRPEWWLGLGIVGGIPLLGLLIDRPVWGVLVLAAAATMLPRWEPLRFRLERLPERSPAG